MKYLSTNILALSLSLSTLLLSSCATQSQFSSVPKSTYKPQPQVVKAKPITEKQANRIAPSIPLNGRLHVRTTSYTHSESDHRKYGRKTALGTILRSGKITSAASDWSRFPVGTTFKIEGDPRLFIVDDYGGALVGTNTIDIYCPTRTSMDKRGTKYCNIRILKWGSYSKSLRILKDRTHARHVRAMVNNLRKRNI